ncbi:PH domain-containing protein [Polymorphospora rubra]|uniref:PH domain-containing protein n=1 Tax=Polymorphospora rubra TaxID=338584 RepID=UPI003F4D0913
MNPEPPPPGTVPPAPGPPPGPETGPPAAGPPPGTGGPVPVTGPVPGPDGIEPRQRLHPLSPFLNGAKSLLAIIAAMSWSTLNRVGLGWFALMVVVLLLGSLVLYIVSWYNTGYHVVGRELRIHEGLLWRRTRAIPLERLQAVEVVRPLLARLSGLAELRLEVVGGGKTEAPLAYLRIADAAVLRDRLLALAGRAGAATAPAAGIPQGPPGTGGPAPEPGPAGVTLTKPVEAPGRDLHAVSNRDLLVSQLLTPQAFLVPFGIAFVLYQFLSEGSFSFIAVASGLTAMAGVLLQPVRRVIDDWNFRLVREDERLRVRHGLLETRAQTVPLVRVQAIGATWPLLWRPKGWLYLRLHVAGVTVGEGDSGSTDRLLPVGVGPVAQAIMDEVLPRVDLTALPLAAPPARARWLHPFAQPVMGAALTDEVFAVRSGPITRQLMVVPYARVQSVRVVQGPLQRRLGLATVYADTAGGPAAAAGSRDLWEAWAMAADLTARARHARATGTTPFPTA